MKKVIIVFSLFVLVFMVAGCGYSPVSIEILFNNETVAQCKKADITDLSPKNGGYRFHCSKKSSIYVVYDTINKETKGSVSRIWLDTYKSKTDEKKHGVIYAYHKYNKSCSLTKNVIYKPASYLFQKTLLGNLKKGTYQVIAVKPCGKVLIKIGDAKT